MKSYRFWNLQFTLVDLVLIILVIAAWIAFSANRIREQQFTNKVANLLLGFMASEELFVDDDTQCHAVAQSCFRHPDES